MATKLLPRNKRFKYQRPPILKYGDFTIKYIQELYDNRYYIVVWKFEYYNNEIMRVPATLINRIGIKPFWFLDSRDLMENAWLHNRFYRFQDRVNRYDEYLDKSCPDAS